MIGPWWKGETELVPGALSAHWARPEVPAGRTLLWTSMALRVRIFSPDLSNTEEVVATSRLSACVRSNSFIEARVGEEALLVVRADEIPSPFGVSMPREAQFKDMTISGRPIRIKSDEALAFKFVFDDRECKCPEPHSRKVHLELTVNGMLEEEA